jgi:hypothetical protein
MSAHDVEMTAPERTHAAMAASLVGFLRAIPKVRQTAALLAPLVRVAMIASETRIYPASIYGKPQRDSFRIHFMPPWFSGQKSAIDNSIF